MHSFVHDPFGRTAALAVCLLAMACASVAGGLVEAGAQTEIAVVDKPVTATEATVVFVRLSADARGAVNSVDRRENIRVVLEGVEVPAIPAGIRIAVGRRAAESVASPDIPGYVSTVTFFGEPPGSEQTFVVDIAPTLRRLKASERLSEIGELPVALLVVPVRPDRPTPDALVIRLIRVTIPNRSSARTPTMQRHMPLLHSLDLGQD